PANERTQLETGLVGEIGDPFLIETKELEPWQICSVRGSSCVLKQWPGYLSNLRLLKSIFSMPLGSLLPIPGKPPPAAPPPICSCNFCSSSMEGIPPPPGIPGIPGIPPPRLGPLGFLRLPFLPLRPFGFFFVA